MDKHNMTPFKDPKTYKERGYKTLLIYGEDWEKIRTLSYQLKKTKIQVVHDLLNLPAGNPPYADIYQIGIKK